MCLKQGMYESWHISRSNKPKYQHKYEFIECQILDMEEFKGIKIIHKRTNKVVGYSIK